MCIPHKVMNPRINETGRAFRGYGESKPSSYFRLIAQILVTKFALQVAFLALNYPGTHHELHDRQQEYGPDRICQDSYTCVKHCHRKIEGIARKAEWAI